MGLNLDEAQRSVGECTGGRHAYDLQHASPTAAKLGDNVQLPRLQGATGKHELLRQGELAMR